jgi:hypothetical protein
MVKARVMKIAQKEVVRKREKDTKDLFLRVWWYRELLHVGTQYSA